MYDIKNTKW